jgi:NitT/TauT family transport system permease protein
MLVLVLAILWGLWSGYRWLWIREGWTWPFVVDSTTMPHIYDILRQLFAIRPRVPRRHPSRSAPARGVVHREGGTRGLRARRLVRLPARRRASQFRLLQRGLLPYVVASQTVPILAVAPIVVVYLGSLHSRRLVLGRRDRELPDLLPGDDQHAAGLQSTDRRALELMRSYAAAGRACSGS